MRSLKWRSILLGIVFIPFISLAQKDTLIQKLDSLEKKTDTVKNNTDADAYNETTKITFPIYFKLLGSDLKQQITAPFRGNRQDWLRFAGLAAGTAALSFTDKPLQKAALKFRDSSKTVRNISKFITNVGGTSEMYSLGALALYGFVFKDEKVKTTTLLASQAYISAAVIETALKFLASRQRPSYVDPQTGERSPKFHGPFYGKTDDFRSFPSGHATAAFAAATVYAMEFKKSVWVPIVSYTAASLISLSRITENKHWATDVLLGATLGYLCGRQVVNNYHRYAKIKSGAAKKNSVSFNLNYNNGALQPGFTYKF